MREHALTSWWQSAGSRRDDDLAAIDISSLKLTAGALAPVDLTKQMRFIAPDDGNEDDRTVMAVALPAPVGPGETITLDIAFTAKIPRPFARTGAIGNYFFIAQWFPKIGVLDAAGRWNCHQFHVGTEFFADFGVYDVRMTVPRGWPLAATGRERERTDNADGTTTHRYYQEDVHDFAWTTSPDFVEARERFEHPGLPPVEMRLHAAARARVAGRAPFRKRARDAPVLRRMVRRVSLRPHHDRRSRVAERDRRHGIPDAVHRRHMVADAARGYLPRRHRRARGRASMVVRHGRHQRVRGCLDGRRHQPVCERARHGRGISRRPRGAAILRRVRAVGARRRAMGSADIRRVAVRLPQQPDRRHPGDAVIPVLAAHVDADDLREARALASYARARARLDDGAADPRRRSSSAGSSSTRRPAICFRWRTK